MSLELTITNAGRAALTDAQNGGFSRVLITNVAFGSVAHQPSASATQLNDEIKRINSISGTQTAEDIIHLTAVDNSNDEYSVREIGFYTDSGVLLGICSAPDTLIIEKSAVSSLFIAFDMTLQPDDAAVIEFGNTDFLLPAATTTAEGAMRFANMDERLELTADNVAMTPAGVKQAINSGTAAAAVKLSTDRTFQATGDVTGSATSDLANGVSISLSLSSTGIQAGSYRQVTVDAKGRVTGGSNPTTLAGYGITDAVPSGRTITAGTGLSGGGSLGANRTLDVLYGNTAGTAAQGNDSRIVNALQTSQRSAANGVAALDANAKVPLSQIPDSIVGQVEYMGVWNAASNTPTLPTTPAGKGHYYVVTTGGTRFGHTFAVGDWCISDGSKWDKVDNTDAVSSINGRTGAVTGLVESNDARLSNAREWTAETVSQNEAEGGTSTVRRAWTAERIRQAVSKFVAFSATKLTTARSIGGVLFDGTANINLPGVNTAGNQNTSGNAATASKLETGRYITLGSASKTFDGSASIAWTLAEIGAAPASHSHSYAGSSASGGAATSALACTGNSASATKLATARYITLGSTSKTFDGSENVAWTLAEIGAAPASHSHSYAGSSAAGGAATSALACTGNSASATKLATARSIGGVLFDGTANINLPGVNTAGNQDTSGNSATATKLAAARSITLAGDLAGSASFDGSANISISAAITNDSHYHGSSTITSIAPTVAGSGIAGVSYGQVGSMIMAQRVSGGATASGSIVSGGTISPATVYGSGDRSIVMTGSWRCMGAVLESSTGRSELATTNFLRIS